MPCCSDPIHRWEDVMAKYTLISFKTCPWVQRSAILLREKNTEFEFRHIEPDNRPDWFLAISPHKKVPVLRLDDRISLFASSAIAARLDETARARTPMRQRKPTTTRPPYKSRCRSSGSKRHSRSKAEARSSMAPTTGWST